MSTEPFESDDHEYKERRKKPSLKEALVFKKEISLGWILGFAAAGTANFVTLVWMAATLVNTVATLQTDVNNLKLTQITISTALTGHSIELTRQVEIDKVHTDRLNAIEAEQRRIQDSINELWRRSK